MTTSPNRPPLSRRRRIALAIGATLLALPVLALAVLLTFDWNRARPWLGEKAGEALGRPFAIAGDLTVDWERRIVAEPDRTWRDAIPWPHLVARDVRMGNPPGMAPGAAVEMARADQFSFALNPFALLAKRIEIPVLRFDAPAVELRRGADGRNNWTFKPADKPSPWTLDLERVVLAGGVVHLQDALRQADLTADIDTINADPSYGVQWTVRGKLAGDTVKGGGKAGAVLSLRNQSAPYPVQAKVAVGATSIALEGSLTKPAALAALDLRLKVAGPSMARSYALTRVVLPETPAYRTEGRLTGQLGEGSSRWTYERFTGTVGSSDIAGTLEYRSGKPRPTVSGNVVSRRLDFSDLGPLIGADSNASKAARGVAPVQPANKLLPVETFRTERWTSADADVTFRAEHIVRDQALPINRLASRLVLKDGVLTLDPLNFDMAGGHLHSTIRLDGRGKAGKDAIKAQARISARHLGLKRLFPGVRGLKGSVGQINGDAALSATGNSVASMLAAADGEVKALVDEGTISKLLLEQMGLNIGNIVLTKLLGDKQVTINCVAADFAVANGLMHTRSLVADTEEAIVHVDGSISLAEERLDLTMRPETKGLRVFSLRAPIYIKGSFKQPEVSIDKGVLALRAGGALALGALAPVAALLPLVKAGPGATSQCATLLAKARAKPTAAPPGTKK